MRYSSTHRQETFDRIVKAASRLFNERGYNGIGVDGIMKAVGMTAGGFYAHFRSKDVLLAKALETAFQRFHGVLLADLDGASREEWLDTVIRRYLSRQHRDEVAGGCALPTLAADVARGKASARKIFEEYLEKLVDESSPQLETDGVDQKDARDEAYALLALSVGGILLARAVRDPDLSDRIVLASRHAGFKIAGLKQKESNRSRRKL